MTSTVRSSSSVATLVDGILQGAPQMLAILALAASVYKHLKLSGVDVPPPIGNLLDARDRCSLASLQRGDEVRRIQQAGVRSGVQPRLTTLQDLEAGPSRRDVSVVDVRDLQLAA